MGRPSTYTPERKADVLAVYESEGLAEAARQTGVPKGTIASWAYRTHTHSVANDRTAAANRASTLRWEERRLEMVHEMGRVAAKAMRVAETMLDIGTPSKAKDATTMMAILVDKAQLLSGAATGRHEVIDPRRQVAERRDELAERRMRGAA